MSRIWSVGSFFGVQAIERRRFFAPWHGRARNHAGSDRFRSVVGVNRYARGGEHDH
jgi:hypothetical protein